NVPRAKGLAWSRGETAKAPSTAKVQANLANRLVIESPWRGKWVLDAIRLRRDIVQLACQRWLRFVGSEIPRWGVRVRRCQDLTRRGLRRCLHIPGKQFASQKRPLSSRRERP